MYLKFLKIHQKVFEFLIEIQWKIGIDFDPFLSLLSNRKSIPVSRPLFCYFQYTQRSSAGKQTTVVLHYKRKENTKE